MTGVVHPEKVLRNGGARLGDKLVLTKPLGTGVIATAVKGRLASPSAEAAAIEVMTALNRLPGACLETATLHAITDITGFGLLGHALEMAAASHVEVTFFAHQVPVLAAAREHAALGLVPGGSSANRRFCEKHLQVAAGIDPLLVDLVQ